MEWICHWCNLILKARKSQQETFCYRCQMDIDIGSGKTRDADN